MGVCLGFALLCMQTVALLHGVWHAPHAAAVLASASGAAEAGEAWLGHTQGSAVCRLIDQLAHADAPAPEAVQITLGPVPFERHATQPPDVTVAPLRGVQARAPPRG